MSKYEASLHVTWQELKRGVDPNVAKDIGYEVPEQYLSPHDGGRAVVALTKPEIPADVKDQLDAFRAANPSSPDRNKDLDTINYLKNRSFE